jgi:predicted nucleic acid-binding protein
MGTGYLLDSNVIIGYLAGKIPDAGMAALSGIVDVVPHISVIAQIEVLRFKDTPDNEKVLADFINTSVIHPLDNTVVQRTIALCKQNKIKLPDAIIAATALVENFTLVTRNVEDFKNIASLNVLNPWDLSE